MNHLSYARSTFIGFSKKKKKKKEEKTEENAHPYLRTTQVSTLILQIIHQ